MYFLKIPMKIALKINNNQFQAVLLLSGMLMVTVMIKITMKPASLMVETAVGLTPIQNFANNVNAMKDQV